MRLAIAIMVFMAGMAHAAVTHVKVFVQQSTTSSASTATFTTSATNANDAVCIQVAAAAATLPTGATLTATAWSFTQITSVTPWPTVAAAVSFCAIAPDTSSVTFTATFTGGVSFTATSVIGDEFSGNDTTGGATTFDAQNSATATSGSPTVSVTPANNDDGLWGAAQDSTSAVGSGFTKGADDGGGDWTEWKILSGGSGTPQTVNMSGGPGYIMQAISIKPLGTSSNFPWFNKEKRIDLLDSN